MCRRKPRLYAHDVTAPSGRSHVSRRPAAHQRNASIFVYRVVKSTTGYVCVVFLSHRNTFPWRLQKIEMGRSFLLLKRAFGFEPGCALSGREFFDFFLHVRQKLNPISGSKQESRSGPAAEGRRSVT